MFRQLLRFILGSRLETKQLSEQKYGVLLGTPILSSDAISSVAYAVEEILWIMIPAIGMASYIWMPRVAGAIILLLFILVFSYRQTVAEYPNGGGAYIVAKANISPTVGLIAGSALSVDYILTVAVSISSGTAAITSAFANLYSYRVEISVLMVILMVIGNLRGVRESARIFSIPTYLFVFSIIALIIAGVIKHMTGNYTPIAHEDIGSLTMGTQAITVFLLLRAFSSGCAAVTGVEAISNAVPNFRKPSAVNAGRAYFTLGLFVFITFGGVAYLAKIYQVVPTPHITAIAQITMAVFGKGFMFYVIQFATATILVMAANTAFADFPMLFSVMAVDGYVPRQLAMRGHRLNFSNGIIVLASLAIILIIVFRSNTVLLIPLYALGVFTSFTLSQTGMVIHWLREKPAGWRHKCAINGLGAFVTFVATIIIGITKFSSGAWIVFLIIPIFVLSMIKIKSHYNLVAEQLNIPNEMLGNLKLSSSYSNHVIIPISSLNMMVIKALRYAKSISLNIEVFHVETFEGEADKLRNKWQQLNTDIPLVIKQSPYREVIGPLKEYIYSEEHTARPGDIVTVLLPQFIVPKWWQVAFHNNTSVFIANALLHSRNIVISVLPFYLKDIDKGQKEIRAI
jgi:amino acid transporter